MITGIERELVGVGLYEGLDNAVHGENGWV